MNELEKELIDDQNKLRKLKNYNLQLGEVIAKYREILKKKETEKLELLKIQNRLLENEEPQEEAHQERRKFSDSHTLEPYQPEAHNIIQVKRCYIIKNLPYSYMKQDLYRNFSKIGLIERIFFPCHGIAYIYFEGFFETLPALTIELTIGGRRLEAKEKQSIPIPLTTCSIMASGKVSCLSKSDLVKHFSKFGNIVNLKNLPRKSLSNSGCYQFIFIKFSDPSSVLLAIETPLQKIKTVSIDVKRAKDF